MTDPRTLPAGWTCPRPRQCPGYARSGDGITVDLDVRDLLIEWTEDPCGTPTTKSVMVPTALLRALLARVEVADA